MNLVWLIPVFAYLLGSVPFGFLLVRARGGPDVRSVGSGNIGAANVWRNVGALAGALTLVLDAGKGYLAVWLAGRIAGGNLRWMTLAAVLAVVGHIFPVWLGFHGGKGVATGLGVFLPICPAAVAAAAALWLAVVVLSGYSSLGSIGATVAFPLLLYLLYAPRHAPPTYLILGTVSISLLILARHRENIQRLIAGTENRLRFRR